MSWSRIVRSQALVARNVLRGWPITYTSPSAMTLDPDDVALAGALLADPSGWHDVAPVEAFERRFAAWIGSGHAFAFASGRIALRAAIEALALSPGAEIVLPGYTCVVVVNAIRNAGLIPVFADIELETYGLDKDALCRAISARTRAVLLHHLYGFVARDFEATLEVARARGLAVIEDCAQAAGAAYRGRRVGTFGDIAIFSGDPSKPFTCIQGGLATTNDGQLAARLTKARAAAAVHDAAAIARRLRNVELNYVMQKDPQRWWKAELLWHRRGSDYFYGIPGNEVQGGPPLDAGCRMAAPIARLAINQLEKLDHYNDRRRANARRWDEWCDASGFTRPTVVAGSAPIVLRYPVLVTSEMKRNLRWAYRTLGVVPGTWFETHMHPAPEHLDGVPNATTAVERCINFPTLFSEDRWEASTRDRSSAAAFST
ncbi:MAG TPA: DegT/DnrJ/EryC1/StrS family aminotransferase [Vicinamibacterales bacterium]|nr:DegT/DnrJ/EryC1/StrS family aminotransferase [Vicinamibacterales bacterium]